MDEWSSLFSFRRMQLCYSASCISHPRLWSILHKDMTCCVPVSMTAIEFVWGKVRAHSQMTHHTAKSHQPQEPDKPGSSVFPQWPTSWWQLVPLPPDMAIIRKSSHHRTVFSHPPSTPLDAGTHVAVRPPARKRIEDSFAEHGRGGGKAMSCRIASSWPSSPKP